MLPFNKYYYLMLINIVSHWPETEIHIFWVGQIINFTNGNNTKISQICQNEEIDQTEIAIYNLKYFFMLNYIIM